jgi:hypothetical protein
MRINLTVARATVAVVVVSLLLPACTTTQLQKQYPSFDACFREQKVISSVTGGILGGVIGGVVGGRGDKGKVLAAAGAIAGVIVGQKVAWQSCLQAFPPRAQTTLIAPPAALGAPRPAGPGAVPAAVKSLSIKSLTAQPLTFGRDLEVSAQYVFVSDKPDARDVKARVYRNLVFVTPDGQRQEIASSSEDTIQQGTSRTTFAIPTPSTQDAKELLQTRDWAVRLIVEADGMRSDEVVPLQVPELPQAAQAPAGTASQQQSQSQPKVSESPPQASQPAQEPERMALPAGTQLLAAPNATRVLSRTKKVESATVLQRTKVRKVTWIQVELTGGVKGWIREARK